MFTRYPVFVPLFGKTSDEVGGIWEYLEIKKNGGNR